MVLREDCLCVRATSVREKCSPVPNAKAGGHRTTLPLRRLRQQGPPKCPAWTLLQEPRRRPVGVPDGHTAPAEVLLGGWEEVVDRAGERRKGCGAATETRSARRCGSEPRTSTRSRAERIPCRLHRKEQSPDPTLQKESRFVKSCYSFSVGILSRLRTLP